MTRIKVGSQHSYSEDLIYLWTQECK